MAGPIKFYYPERRVLWPGLTNIVTWSRTSVVYTTWERRISKGSVVNLVKELPLIHYYHYVVSRISVFN